jgi:hypothetical protein
VWNIKHLIDFIDILGNIVRDVFVFFECLAILHNFKFAMVRFADAGDFLHRKDYLQGSQIPAVISPTARLGQMVTLSPRRLAEQPLWLSHNTESQAQGPSSRSWRPSTAERRRWRPSSADGGPAECRRRWRPSAAYGGRALPRAGGSRTPPKAAKLRR